MNKDFEQLYYLIEKQFKVINNSVSFITRAVVDMGELKDETYLMTKDTFELLLLCRALRDMLEEKL
jgi:hypothetical protein